MTLATRESSLKFGQAYMPTITPDGTLDQGDRQALTFLYSGIEAQEIVIIDIPNAIGLSSPVAANIGVSSAINEDIGLASAIDDDIGITSTVNDTIGLNNA